MKFLLADPRITVLAQIDLKNCTVTIEDGGAKSVTLKMGEGNFTWTEKKNREYKKDRGKLDIVRDGDEEPVEVNFEGMWEYLVGTEAEPSLVDIVKGPRTIGGVNLGADYTSVDTDACQPYACKITVANVPTPTGCGDTETYVFDLFRYDQLSFDIKGGSISCQGKCNILEPTITRGQAPS